MKKLPVCKNCGKLGHCTYACWAKKKPRVKPLKTASNPLLKSKTSKVSPFKKKDQSERRKLIKELDKYYSRYVRLSEANKFGYIYCITCGTQIHYRLADNCHWIKRGYFNTRYDLRNQHAGCQLCNRVKNGNYEAYDKVMKAKLGEDGCLKLWDKALKRRKIPTHELKEMLVKIKQDYKDLVNDRKEKGYVC